MTVDRPFYWCQPVAVAALPEIGGGALGPPSLPRVPAAMLLEPSPGGWAAAGPRQERGGSSGASSGSEVWVGELQEGV